MSSIKSTKGIHFEQSRDLDEMDIGHESNLYEITIFGRIHTIAIGKHRKVPDLRHYYYIPVYLIYKGRVKSQIGAFQFESAEKSEKAQIQPFLDKDGEFDLNRFSDLILYHFADDTFFYDTHSELSPAEIGELESTYVSEQVEKSKESQNGKDKEVEEEDLSEESGALILTESDLRNKKAQVPSLKSADSLLKSGIFKHDPTRKSVETLLEETKGQASDLRKAYQKGSHKSSAPWIEKFMQNREFNIVETANNGDCLFDSIRLAFSQIGYNTTIDKLRSILVSELTDEQYDLYRTLYLNTVVEKEDIERRMKVIVKTVDELKKRLAKTADKSDRDKIIKSAKAVETEYNGLKGNLVFTNEMISEVGFMKGIADIDGLREYIKTPLFWADAWAISILEEKLNIKLMIFSEKSYINGDHNNVFQCGNETFDHIIPTPNHYIMVTYSGKHYRIISYKNKYIFKFSEIPYDAKVQVVIKCLERNSGAFYKIQDFRNFKSKLGVPAEEGSRDAEEQLDQEHESKYNKDVVFMYYNRSNGYPKAGKGSGEKIPEKSVLEYSELNKPENKDWRRKLDDYWITEFTVDSQKWSSVEHYYQAAKFKKQNPDFAKLFSLDSDSEISREVDKAREAGSKPSNKLRPASVKIDADFYGGRNDMERERAVYAKFSQNVDLRNILVATKSAKLMQYVAKSPAETDFILMRVREKLNGEKPPSEK
jgi:predicted NAD-dependent protein-ADP-ribosyltransferase YbiA (DUF1768 family)